ncbi:MAG: phosphoribosyl-ATP diphosphatase [Coriobacteriales bacterium]|jgi:phosphoribosyl-ATP pyrophosphohydrolase|nr:phosphoribosyl-ATP diphosphatase [Coriobacteriales bacterium]
MGERTANVKPCDIGKTLNTLSDIIQDRHDKLPEGSYTAKLLTGPEDYALKKITEEATEVVLACKDNDHDHIRYEAADLIYHLMVVTERYGVSISELAGELAARM